MTNLVIIKDNQAMTTSRMVAATFEKQHAHVLRDIKNLECSTDFHESNFGLMFYTSELGNGATRQDKEVPMTRDGFTFLAMGYTGKRAAEFKEAYIKEFNKMEASLKAPDYLENKYTIEDLIIAQANSIKELKEEVQAMQLTMVNQLPVEYPLELSAGQTQLFPVSALVSVHQYCSNRGFSNKSLSQIGRLATANSIANKIEYKKLPNGNLYQISAIETAIQTAQSKNRIEIVSATVSKNTATSPEILKIREQLKKNPLAQELKGINVGKYKSYRGNLASILKNLIYNKIHKCSDIRFSISQSSKSKGWVKVRRVS